MTPDKNFKLTRANKTLVALLCKSDQDRNHLKAALIQSQLAGEAARRASLKGKGTNPRNVATPAE